MPQKLSDLPSASSVSGSDSVYLVQGGASKQATVDQLLASEHTVRIVTASGAVTMTAADEIVEIAQTVPAACAVTGPTSPTTGKIYRLKDGAGNASTYNITLTPASGTIDGAANYVIAENYGAVSFYWNGTNLRVIS